MVAPGRLAEGDALLLLSGIVLVVVASLLRVVRVRGLVSDGLRLIVDMSRRTRFAFFALSVCVEPSAGARPSLAEGGGGCNHVWLTALPRTMVF